LEWPCHSDYSQAGRVVGRTALMAEESRKFVCALCLGTHEQDASLHSTKQYFAPDFMNRWDVWTQRHVLSTIRGNERA
jgi:hypothetical protein